MKGRIVRKKIDVRIVEDVNKVTVIILGRPSAKSNNKERISGNSIMSFISGSEFASNMTNNVFNNLIVM